MPDQAFDKIAETASSSDPSLHRVLIVGGGAGGLRLTSMLGASLGRRHKASITLLDKSRIHVWKPLLHEIASGSMDSETDSLELIAHARRRHYRYRIGAMVGLNRAARQVHVAPSLDEDGQTVIPPRVLGYDTLVIAVGSLSNDFGTPGVAEHAIALDTVEQAARFNRRMINACLRANAQYEPLRPGQLRCVIVGAGATGVELAAELHKSMRDLASYNLDHIDFDKHIKIDLIEAAPRILPALPESIAARTADVLRKLGVTLRTGTRVMAVRPGEVVLDGGEMVPAEMIVWAAGIKAPDFLRDIDGLETDSLNRLVVRPTMQTTRDDDVFAIGDCAACVLPGAAAPLPPRAQTARQQADYMVKVVKARLRGAPLPAFKYRDLGSLVALADYNTVGVILNGLKLEGLFARLAYRSLHQMHMQALHGNLKVALDGLARVLTRRTEPRIKLH
ncbi:MAG TPA: NAD(P)/FAD-dependent oxidoreductase [Xanthobacteraceae bacterium]|jgi:NADH dehydrogenase|nr:NAD(P)/FAD-dependent oxidoreductase [Xanthobacteraceae bacterium]